MTTAQKTPSPDLIDQLLAGYQKPEDLIGEHGLLKQLQGHCRTRPASRDSSAAGQDLPPASRVDGSLQRGAP
jgi:hypothetical protein